MEDRKIVMLLWQRSESALTALADRFGKRLMSTAMNILGIPQDAEEAVNDTYLAVWNTVPPKSPDPLAGYVLLQFGTGAAAPPEEIIDFVLDRPFLFAITTNDIPLFVGTVNNP